jgi:peptide/nickel transport system permease protein
MRATTARRGSSRHTGRTAPDVLRQEHPGEIRPPLRIPGPRHFGSLAEAAEPAPLRVAAAPSAALISARASKGEIPVLRDAWSRLRRDPVALFGFAVIAVAVFTALFAEYLAPWPPDRQFFDGLTLEGAPLPPNERFWLGTDLLGRDLLSRLIFGARTSLVIGVVANGVAVAIGALLGVTAGFLRGWIGTAIMRFTDLMMAFPALLLAIALAAIFSPSLWIVALVIAMVNWVQIARVVYTETTSLAEREFIEASRAVGAGPARILVHHILPHLGPTLLVWATLGVATTVLLEATLSYLGVGVRPPTPSWGNIIFENQTYFATAPWLVFFPGAAILLLALSFNLVGDALRDALDPTQRGREP